MSLMSGSVRIPIDPLLIRCIGCSQLVPKAFVNYGKLWTIIKWRTEETRELLWDALTGKSTMKVTEKRIPISGWKRGAIGECCLTSKCRSYMNRKGETVKEPLCKIDPSQTATTTIIPVTEKILRTISPPSRVPVNSKTLLGKPHGGGALVWSPDTGQTFQEVHESVHGPSYNKFTR